MAKCDTLKIILVPKKKKKAFTFATKREFLFNQIHLKKGCNNNKNQNLIVSSER